MTTLDPEHEAIWKAQLKGPFEGTVLWPYLDTDGNVTVATGYMIASLSEFESLKWIGGMGALTIAAAEWKELRASKPGMRAAHYESVTSLRLSEDEADALLEKRITSTEEDAINSITGLSAMPQPAIMGCLDMAFNMGMDRFHDQFFGPTRHFGPALYAQHWLICSTECRRKEVPAPGGIQKSRNDWTAALFASLAAPQVVT